MQSIIRHDQILQVWTLFWTDGNGQVGQTEYFMTEQEAISWAKTANVPTGWEWARAKHTRY